MKFLTLLSFLLVSASALGQNVDETSKTYHVFPVIADGEFGDGAHFFSHLYLTNTSYPNNPRCAYTLYGISSDRLVPSPVFSIIDDGAAFTFPENNPNMLVRTTGAGSDIETGYATLECTAPVAAFIQYGFYDANYFPYGIAAVFSSQPGEFLTLWINQWVEIGQRMAVGIANDQNRDANCSIEVFYKEEYFFEFSIGSKSSHTLFIDEILSLPEDEFIIRRGTLFCDSPVSAIGLFFDGLMFSTFPMTVFR